MSKIVVFLIVLTSFFRLYNLAGVPPSPSLDEVSLGYNAYSILRTETDEYGAKFPILLRAYDDWRPALYIYLVIPFVQLFDLSVLAVRLPSAILSITTILTTYFLVKKLFEKKKYAKHLALLSSFLLAISPWHIYISRLGHEVNAGLAFFILGLTFFLYKRIFLAGIFFALSLMSYQTEKVFLPIFLLGIIVIYRDELLKIKRNVFLTGIICLLFLLPFIKESLSENAQIRLKGTNVFTANKERFDREVALLAEAKNSGDLLGQVVHNRRTVVAQIVFESYISHFNPQWLFFNPSSDKHKIPNVGLLYFFEAPFLIVGILVLLFGKFDWKIKSLLSVWFLAAPIAAAITTEAPHAMRSFVFLPTWQIFTAIGIYEIYQRLRHIIVRRTYLVLLGIIVLISIGNMLYNYFTVFPKEQSKSFQYALSQTIPFVLEIDEKYDRVIFSNHDNLYQSYMFFLFYTKYDPTLYQKQGGTGSGGFAETHAFGKYEFRPIYFRSEKTGNTLFVGNPNDFPSVEPLFIGKYLDGSTGTKVVH